MFKRSNETASYHSITKADRLSKDRSHIKVLGRVSEDEIKGLYVPKTKIEFYDNKFKVWQHSDDYSLRLGVIFGSCLLLFFPFYGLGHAIMSICWWKMILFGIPSYLGLRKANSFITFIAINVKSIHLHKCGEKVSV